MQQLSERLSKSIQKKESIRAGDRLAVAVSGGADSVALLRLLLELRAELGIVLSVAHINHKLRGQEADADEQFVAQLAQRHGLEFYVCDAPVEGKNNSGVEAVARRLRYGFFRKLAQEGRVAKIATAHTLDDQAETVLLRLFRGTGIRGLSGIHPRLVLEEGGHVFGEVVRPLLDVRHSELQEFLRHCGQDWREDSSNRNIAFLRNRVRHRLLPVIAEEFGDTALEHLGELAEIARAEEEHWEQKKIHGTSTPGLVTSSSGSLRIEPLLGLSLAAQRRAVRGWLETNAHNLSISFRLIEQVLGLAHGASGRKIELSDGWSLHHAREVLSLELDVESEDGRAGEGYEHTLPVPGAVEVPELHARFEAQLADTGSILGDEEGQWLDPALLPKQILIRNWRAGDRYWPAHTAAARKVKELLSDRHVSGTEKKLWPVAVAEGSRLIWMRGFSVPAALRPPTAASKAICIRERRE